VQRRADRNNKDTLLLESAAHIGRTLVAQPHKELGTGKRSALRQFRLLLILHDVSDHLMLSQAGKLRHQSDSSTCIERTLETEKISTMIETASTPSSALHAMKSLRRICWRD